MHAGCRVNVLVACEYSGTVRDAFIAAGHEASSCDLLPTEAPGPHHQGDVVTLLRDTPDGWFDLIIAHPECTKLCVSGNHVYAAGKPRHAERLAAAAWTFDLWQLCKRKAHKVCFENPTGVLPTLTAMPRPQFVQPYNFGHDASKATGLFLHNLPPLRNGRRVAGRLVVWNGKTVERWANQTDSGQNRLPPSDDRWKLRSTTYTGIAQAMAKQWAKA